MTPLAVGIQRLEHAQDLPLPDTATDGSAGVDLRAAVATTLLLGPGDRVLVPTGISISLPRGFEAQVRPRSGLALAFGVTVLNAPGTVDADYRGEIGVILVNHGREPFRIERGARIAQLVVARCERITWTEGGIEPSARGSGGFGSTG